MLPKITIVLIHLLYFIFIRIYVVRWFSSTLHSDLCISSTFISHAPTFPRPYSIESPRPCQRNWGLGSFAKQMDSTALQREISATIHSKTASKVMSPVRTTFIGHLDKIQRHNDLKLSFFKIWNPTKLYGICIWAHDTY